MLGKYVLASRAAFAKQAGVRSFAVSSSYVQAALKDPEHINWNEFFHGIKPADIAGTDV